MNGILDIKIHWFIVTLTTSFAVAVVVVDVAISGQLGVSSYFCDDFLVNMPLERCVLAARYLMFDGRPREMFAKHIGVHIYDKRIQYKSIKYL